MFGNTFMGYKLENDAFCIKKNKFCVFQGSRVPGLVLESKTKQISLPLSPNLYKIRVCII